MFQDMSHLQEKRAEVEEQKKAEADKLQGRAYRRRMEHFFFPLVGV